MSRIGHLHNCPSLRLYISSLARDLDKPVCPLRTRFVAFPRCLALGIPGIPANSARNYSCPCEFISRIINTPKKIIRISKVSFPLERWTRHCFSRDRLSVNTEIRLDRASTIRNYSILNAWRDEEEQKEKKRKTFKGTRNIYVYRIISIPNAWFFFIVAREE